jgi:2-methylcitrate dehydratase PrpD
MNQIASIIPIASAIEVLAEFASTASGDAHRERISVHIADAVIALLAGRASGEGKAIVDFFARAEGSPLAMISANAAAMRLSEIDDIHRPSAVTASAIAFPAALGMATLTSATPQRFADAIFVGQALSIRLAMALGGVGLMTRGFWPSYLVAPFGAAATAARMLNLTPARTAHALALALAQTPHQVGRSVGARPGRWLLFGNAIRSGCLAALAAADGIDGDPALLNSAWLQTIGGPATDLGFLTPAADSPAPVEQLSIKPHCAAKQTLAAIYGLQRLIAEGLAPAAIESLDLFVPTAYAGMIDREPASASRLASMVSVRWQLALAAMRPASLDDVARDALPEDMALEKFSAKVKIHADAALDNLYPQSWPARLLVSTGASSREILVEDSPGDPGLRFDRNAIEDKARRIFPGHAAIDLVTQGFDAPSDAAALNVLCQYFKQA